MSKAILLFAGPYRFLSNFYTVFLEYEGIAYSSVEHAYQAAKTDDNTLRKIIAELPTPGHAKKMGRKLVLSSSWEDRKVSVMEELLYEKFSMKNPELQHRLLETGDAYLAETNIWHDTFWGICECTIHRGEGKNMLGVLLMSIREQLVQAWQIQQGILQGEKG